MDMVNEPLATAPPEAPLAPFTRWSLPARIAFRFFALYLTLYIVCTQMFSSLFVLPWGSIPAPAESWTLRTLASWVATDVLHFPKPLTLVSGSGDTPLDFATCLTLLTIAVIGTALWSLADRRRPAYPALQAWFRLFLRFGLGGTLLTYGMIKAIPLQMPYPRLTRLLEPYGNFSLMGVLWSQMGASPAYQIFTGVAEIAAAVMLFIPGLTTLGALIALAAAAQVFVLNMTFDVPVKLFSLHLVVMAAVLLAPDARRLAEAIVLRRAVPGAPERRLFGGRRAQRIVIAAQLVLGGWLVWSAYKSDMQGWNTYGGGAPKPPYYGIWQIEKMTIDGVERAPLVTDYDRFRRIVIERANGISFQRMDDTFMGYPAQLAADRQSIMLVRGQPPQTTTLGQFRIEQPSPDLLVLDGSIGKRSYRMEARLFDREKFLLVRSPRFRWVQDNPFNR
ncbi:MAG: DoxX family protein [Acidobacteriota bacterium]|nr:DoxX family protein [Acidobacteriota bacterium]